MNNNNEQRQKCNRCKMHMTLDKFRKKRDDSYMKQCIQCNAKVVKYRQSKKKVEEKVEEEKVEEEKKEEKEEEKEETKIEEEKEEVVESIEERLKRIYEEDELIQKERVQIEYKDCLHSRSLKRKEVFDNIQNIDWNNLNNIKQKRFRDFLKYIKFIVETGENFNNFVEECEVLDRCKWCFNNMNNNLKLEWKETARSIGIGYINER